VKLQIANRRRDPGPPRGAPPDLINPPRKPHQSTL
jgi:hypothetical protein